MDSIASDGRKLRDLRARCSELGAELEDEARAVDGLRRSDGKRPARMNSLRDNLRGIAGALLLLGDGRDAP